MLKTVHYLHVHDALKKVVPESTINAFTESRHKYQVDMTCLQADFDVANVDMKSELHAKLQRALGAQSVKRFGDRFEVHFSDDNVLALMFGREGVLLRDINKLTDEEQRALLRPSLGSDLSMFRAALCMHQKLAAKGCFDWATGKFPPHARPPMIFWEAQVHRVFTEMDLLEFHFLMNFVMDSFVKRFPRPTLNPALPGENLNGLDSVVAMCACLGVNPRWQDPL